MFHSLLAPGGLAVASLPNTAGLSLLLIDAAVKACLLLAVTMSASWLVRSRSAAASHRIWTLGFAGCLLIPVISLLAPAWSAWA